MTKVRACSGHMPAEGHTWQHGPAGGAGPCEDGRGLGAKTAGLRGGGASRRVEPWGARSPLPHRNDKQLNPWSV